MWTDRVVVQTNLRVVLDIASTEHGVRQRRPELPCHPQCGGLDQKIDLSVLALSARRRIFNCIGAFICVISAIGVHNRPKRKLGG